MLYTMSRTSLLSIPCGILDSLTLSGYPLSFVSKLGNCRSGEKSGTFLLKSSQSMLSFKDA